MNLSSKDLREIENQISLYLQEAGEHIMLQWNSILSLSYKDKRDIATNIDIEVENVLRRKLTALLPEAGFVVEEGETHVKSDLNWVIDPIEGTKFYATHAPYFFTQLALTSSNNPVLGGIYNPVSKQLFTGSAGNGARYNNDFIKLHLRTHPDEAVIDMDFGKSDPELEWKIEVFKSLVKKFYRVRVTSGILIPYLFTGTVDAFVDINKDVKPVDLAPHIVIARECGMRSEYVSANNRQILITSAPALFDIIQSTL